MLKLQHVINAHLIVGLFLLSSIVNGQTQASKPESGYDYVGFLPGSVPYDCAQSVDLIFHADVTKNVTDPRLKHYARSRASYTWISYCQYQLYLASNKYVQEQLGISSKACQAIDSFLKRCQDLRNEFDKSQSDQQDHSKRKEAWIQFCREHAEELDRSANSILSAEQLARLYELGNQIAVRRFGLETILPLLPYMDEANPSMSKKEYSDLKDKISRLSRENMVRGSDVFRKNGFEQGFYSAWLSDVVQDKEALNVVLRAYYTRMARSLSTVDISEMIQVEKLQSPSGISLEQLWSTDAIVKFKDDGSIERKIEVKKEQNTGVKNFLTSLIDPVYSAALELTPAQRGEVRELLANLESETHQRSLQQIVDEVFLPHQKLLFDDYCLWREVDVYGFTASVLHGRLRKHLQLSQDEISELQTNAPEIAQKYEAVYQTVQSEFYDSYDDLFAEHHLPAMCSLAFGDEKWDFSQLDSAR